MKVIGGSGSAFIRRRVIESAVMGVDHCIVVSDENCPYNRILNFSPRKRTINQHVTSDGSGVTNLIFTFVGLWLIDRLGRRTLLYIGSIGYIASLGLCAWAFFTETFNIAPVCIFAFIAAHAIGQGAVIWVFISEIFPNEHRAMGQSLGCFTHWVALPIGFSQPC